MNRNAKVAIGFTLAALIVTAAEAQNTTRVTQTGHMKTVSVALAGGGGYSFYSGSGAGASQGEGQSNATKDELFAGTEQFEKNASEVTEINMDPDSLDMVKGRHAGDAHNMVLNLVRSYEYDKPGMYDVAAVNKFREKLNTGDWHCSVHTRELKTGESTDVCFKRRTDGMREQAIVTVEPKELTFIHRIEREDGGHSEMSELPLMIGPGGGLPMVAELNGPAMRAEMAARMAELRAASPELYRLKSQLYQLRDLQPLDGGNVKVFKIRPNTDGNDTLKVAPPVKPEE